MPVYHVLRADLEDKVREFEASGEVVTDLETDVNSENFWVVTQPATKRHAPGSVETRPA